jgi:hypothetical protein
MYENFAMNAHEARHVSSVRINSAWVGSITLPETKQFLAGSYNKHILAGRGVRDWTHRGWLEVSCFQPPEVRPIPDSPNLQVCLVFIQYCNESPTDWATSRFESLKGRVTSRVESSHVSFWSTRVEWSQVSGYTRVKSGHLFKSSRVNS